MSGKRLDELPDDLAAQLTARVTPMQMTPESRARVRSRLLSRIRADACGTDSETVRSQDGGWFALGPKVRMKLLREDGDTVSFLLQLEPGAVVPAHDHRVDEECMVLAGEVSIGELRLSAGDYHLARAGQPHAAMTSAAGTTLFLRGQSRSHYHAALSAALG